LFPLSDGGDGFLECLQQALGGHYLEFSAEDPFGHPKPVPVLVLPGGIVALECAQVIGLAGLERLDPRGASSRGFGQLLSNFQDAPELWIGLGGSATVDGGADWPKLELRNAKVFCDVETDLRDAARLFGPQKGAGPEDVSFLEGRLMSLGLPTGPRTGAAGGLGAKLQSLGAELLNGADAVLNALDFNRVCRDFDTVITGEGRLDVSTLEGKLPARVAQRARSLGLRVLGHFGCRGSGWKEAAGLFDEVVFEMPE